MTGLAISKSVAWRALTIALIACSPLVIVPSLMVDVIYWGGPSTLAHWVDETVRWLVVSVVFVVPVGLVLGSVLIRMGRAHWPFAAVAGAFATFLAPTLLIGFDWFDQPGLVQHMTLLIPGSALCGGFSAWLYARWTR